MRKLLLGALGLLLSASAWGASYKALLVNLKDGTNVSVMLTDELAVTFTADNLCAVGSGEDVTIPRADILSFSHEEYSAITEIGSETDFENLGGMLRFGNLAEGTGVSLYNLSGVAVRTARVEAGSATMSLDGLTPGIYVVSVNNSSFKINVK
ncbi:MAG: T9SS type A sorting domain-containing protein [Muribaculaceae bacterium]|nr:T9SS type A sorting domain-containing protein [Muribaculaceae bacterium]